MIIKNSKNLRNEKLQASCLRGMRSDANQFFFCVYIHNPYLQRTCQWEKQSWKRVYWNGLNCDLCWKSQQEHGRQHGITDGIFSALSQAHVETPLRPTPVLPYSSSTSPVPVSALLSGVSSAASGVSSAASSLSCCMQETSSFLASSTAALLCPVKRKRRNSDSLIAHWPLIAWLHIGHSFIIHSFLLKGEEPPVCIGCDELLTIEHILLTCSDLTEIRECVCLVKKKQNRRIPVSENKRRLMCRRNCLLLCPRM